MQSTLVSRTWRFQACAGLFLLIASSRSFGGEPPEGFSRLFNGTDLAGWHGMPHFDPYALLAMSEARRKEAIKNWTADARKHWTVDNGELVNDGNGAYLTTDKDFGDIELLVEYKTVPLADSGIYLRATPQVQIWDYTKAGGKWDLGADKGSGGLWNNLPGAPGKDPLVLADKPFGQWNKFRILQVGERVTVYLNDKLVVDHAQLQNFWRASVKRPLHDRATPLLKTAPIQLQTHGGEIRWRNMFIREIPADEANRILRSHNSAGYVDVCNGKDLAGWAGPLEKFTVTDGTIVCGAGESGTIYTKSEYADFAARLEFKLPQGENSGVVIRYQPGESVGRTTAAHQGYLRPAGEWNFLEITAVGPKLVMELNGTRVTETDLSEARKDQPGNLRLRGHLGLCGHGDPAAYRNLQIKTLTKR